MRRAAREFARVLTPYCAPPARATEDIVTWVRSTRAADYVFAINDRRGAGDYVGVWKRVLDRGLPNAGTVTLPRRAGAVEVTVTSRDTGVMIPIRLDWVGAGKPFYAVVKDGRWLGTLAGCEASVLSLANLADGKSVDVRIK